MFGDIVNKYIDEHNLSHTRDVHVRTWKELRKKYGMEAFALLNVKNIREGLKKGEMIIVDGMRSWEEYIYLKKKFPDAKIQIVTIFTDKKKRYSRSAKRKYRSKLYGPERDIDELFGTNMGPTMAFADFIIENNSTLKDFHNKLGFLYKRFSNRN